MREPDHWWTVFMAMAETISRRSKDPRTQVGAVIADRQNRVVSLGYNGPPRRMNDRAVPWEGPGKYPWIIHAEMNAMLFGLANRSDFCGCTLFVTSIPCSKCAPIISHLGVDRVVCGKRRAVVCDDVDWALTQTILEAGGVYVSHMD